MSFHAGEIGAAQPHAGHHIDFKHAQPVRVRNLCKRFGLEDTEVIHENVDGRQPAYQAFATGCRSQVFGNPFDSRVWNRLANCRECGIDARLSPPVDDHSRSFPSEPQGNGVTDAGG